MSLKIPYFRKGAKGTAKSGSAPLRDIKNKKTSCLTRGGNSDYTAHDWITVSTVLGCEHKSGEDCPTGRNYYVCNLFFVFFLQLLGQSTLNFGEGKKSVELSPSG